eukprot:CAMPEP_0113671976 /NCGR_PEP_ID=MMETSP0038_2-20120614/5994_1 /TAXON_ID=2898 /ORGANISM="Cryptomonas paramecium" /LENGTH=293 /DNA_ID=CAMNT_0000588169 /DNA_START=103 /DNA_END=984 /DNA_ORIENTATION=+ /assembly_acc=CAM_ASM_000170
MKKCEPAASNSSDNMSCMDSQTIGMKSLEMFEGVSSSLELGTGRQSVANNFTTSHLRQTMKQPNSSPADVSCDSTSTGKRAREQLAPPPDHCQMAHPAFKFACAPIAVNRAHSTNDIFSARQSTSSHPSALPRPLLFDRQEAFSSRPSHSSETSRPSAAASVDTTSALDDFEYTMGSGNPFSLHTSGVAGAAGANTPAPLRDRAPLHCLLPNVSQQHPFLPQAAAAAVAAVAPPPCTVMELLAFLAGNRAAPQPTAQAWPVTAGHSTAGVRGQDGAEGRPASAPSNPWLAHDG